jgi:hypothetical protein
VKKVLQPEIAARVSLRSVVYATPRMVYSTDGHEFHEGIDGETGEKGEAREV